MDAMTTGGVRLSAPGSRRCAKTFPLGIGAFLMLILGSEKRDLHGAFQVTEPQTSSCCRVCASSSVELLHQNLIFTAQSVKISATEDLSIFAVIL